MVLSQMHVDGRMLYNMDRNVQLRKRLAFPLRVHESSVPFLDSKSIPLALSHRALHQTGIPSRAPPDQPRTELSMPLLLVLRPRAILLPRTPLHTGSKDLRYCERWCLINFQVCEEARFAALVSMSMMHGGLTCKAQKYCLTSSSFVTGSVETAGT